MPRHTGIRWFTTENGGNGVFAILEDGREVMIGWSNAGSPDAIPNAQLMAASLDLFKTLGALLELHPEDDDPRVKAARELISEIVRERLS